VIKPQPEQEPLKTLTASIFTAKANHELILDTRSELGKPQASDTQRQQEARTAAVQTVRRFLIYPWPAGGARTRGIGAGEGEILRRRVFGRAGKDGLAGNSWAERRRKEASAAARRRTERLRRVRGGLLAGLRRRGFGSGLLS